MARQRKRIACRFCGAEPSSESYESKSHFDHSHPASCPFVTDRVPMLNGVRVGDLWENEHTGGVVRVIEIRLGGAGTYVDREPCVLVVDVWRDPKRDDEGELELGLDERPDLETLTTMEPDERSWIHEHPLWSLSEHWDPLTRPGEYPVPWHMETRRGWTSRSADDEWRCPGYRGGAREDEEHAYWHAFHTVVGHGIQWERTNVLWQIDLNAEPSLLPPSVPERKPEPVIDVEPEPVKQPEPEVVQEALF